MFDPGVRQVRQIVERRRRRPHGVVHDAAGRILPRQAAHDIERPAVMQRVDQLQERFLTLRSDDEVDERRSQGPCRYAAWESSRPRRFARAEALRALACTRGRPASAAGRASPLRRADSLRPSGRRTPRNARTIAPAGSLVTLPSTSVHACLPSSTPASDITDNGSGCFPGVVESGLKRTIIAPPTDRMRRATA